VAVALLIGLFAEFARPHAFDEPVLEGIQLAHPMKEIAWFFNDYLRDSGIPALWAMSIAWLLFIRRRPGLAALFVVAMLVGPLNELLKEFFARPRPAGDFIIRENPSGMSFPSGHTMTAVAFFGLWIMVAPLVLPRGAHWPVRIAAASVIILTAVSRVWVAAHWPTDVIAGILFGAAFVGLVWASRHDIDRIAEWLHLRLHSLDVWLVGHTSHAVQPAEIDPIDYHLTLR
jgi:undecaprenyl-diphosphatase